jgi:hypothetical protein
LSDSQITLIDPFGKAERWLQRPFPDVSVCSSWLSRFTGENLNNCHAPSCPPSIGSLYF